MRPARAGKILDAGRWNGGDGTTEPNLHSGQLGLADGQCKPFCRYDEAFQIQAGDSIGHLQADARLEKVAGNSECGNGLSPRSSDSADGSFGGIRSIGSLSLSVPRPKRFGRGLMFF